MLNLLYILKWIATEHQITLTLVDVKSVNKYKVQNSKHQFIPFQIFYKSIFLKGKNKFI